MVRIFDFERFDFLALFNFVHTGILKNAFFLAKQWFRQMVTYSTALNKFHPGNVTDEKNKYKWFEAVPEQCSELRKTSKLKFQK